MKKKSKIFVSLFSFILIFNSLALPALAADPAAAGSPESSSDASSSDVSEYMGELPLESYVPAAPLTYMLTHDGTTLFGDLDESDPIIEYIDTSSDESIEYGVPFISGQVTYIRFYYLNSQNVPTYVQTLYPFDSDSDVHVSLKKKVVDDELRHVITLQQHSSSSSYNQPFDYVFDGLTVDDTQGLYFGIYNERSGSYYSPVNGSFCEPTCNVSFSNNGIQLPSYFSEQEVTYAYFVIPSEVFVQQAISGLGRVDVYAIPTYAGMYTIREYETNNIILKKDLYGRIVNDYHLYALDSTEYTDYVEIYQLTRYHTNNNYTIYNNLRPNDLRYAGSLSLDQGPLRKFGVPEEVNGNLSKSGSFPKYFLRTTSDISLYIASFDQYEAYLQSDEYISSKINENTQIYEQKSDEFKQAIKGFEDLPKPIITSNTVKLPSGSVESIDELSGILSIIWEDKMVKEMLIISLTFVFVGYILFGKRG